MHNIPQNQSVVGKFKDEYAGEPIESFYGTGAKAYCVKIKEKVLKKAKGVKKCAIDKQLTITDYIDVVEKDSKTFCTMYVFKSHLHTIYTEFMKKLALTANDDKRFKIPGTTKTLAWSHKDIWFYENPALNNQALTNMIKDIEMSDERWRQNIDELINAAIELDVEILTVPLPFEMCYYRGGVDFINSKHLILSVVNPKAEAQSNVCKIDHQRLNKCCNSDMWKHQIFINERKKETSVSSYITNVMYCIILLQLLLLLLVLTYNAVYI